MEFTGNYLEGPWKVPGVTGIVGVGESLGNFKKLTCTEKILGFLVFRFFGEKLLGF